MAYPEIPSGALDDEDTWVNEDLFDYTPDFHPSEPRRTAACYEQEFRESVDARLKTTNHYLYSIAIHLIMIAITLSVIKYIFFT